MYSEVKFAPLGRVAGTDGDDQVTAGNDRLANATVTSRAVPVPAPARTRPGPGPRRSGPIRGSSCTPRPPGSSPSTSCPWTPCCLRTVRPDRILFSSGRGSPLATRLPAFRRVRVRAPALPCTPPGDGPLLLPKRTKSSPESGSTTSRSSGSEQPTQRLGPRLRGQRPRGPRPRGPRPRGPRPRGPRPCGSRRPAPLRPVKPVSLTSNTRYAPNGIKVDDFSYVSSFRDNNPQNSPHSANTPRSSASRTHQEPPAHHTAHQPHHGCHPASGDGRPTNPRT